MVQVDSDTGRSWRKGGAVSAGPEDRPQELRERILDATLRVIRERGMARTRTNAIAHAAGCAEGSIYRYFSGKPELLHEVARTRMSSLIDMLLRLPEQAGTATVETNLLEAAHAASSFYGEVVPLLAGVVADADLLEEQRELFVRGDLAPHRAAAALAAYIRAEQELGRVRPDADPETTARLFLVSFLGESFWCALPDHRADEMERDRYARAVVRIVGRELGLAGGSP